MNMIKAQMYKLTNTTITIDGHSFADTEFVSCSLIFHGRAPPHFSNCIFSNCNWSFLSEANTTIRFLMDMASMPEGKMLVMDMLGLGIESRPAGVTLQ